MIHNRIAKYYPLGVEYRPQEQPQAPRGGISRMDWLELKSGIVWPSVWRYAGIGLGWLLLVTGGLAAVWLLGYVGALGAKTAMGW